MGIRWIPDNLWFNRLSRLIDLHLIIVFFHAQTTLLNNVCQTFPVFLIKVVFQMQLKTHRARSSFLTRRFQRDIRAVNRFAGFNYFFQQFNCFLPFQANQPTFSFTWHQYVFKIFARRDKSGMERDFRLKVRVHTCSKSLRG